MAETTEGTIDFDDRKGDGWAVLFPDPKDERPVGRPDSVGVSHERREQIRDWTPGTTTVARQLDLEQAEHPSLHDPF